MSTIDELQAQVDALLHQLEALNKKPKLRRKKIITKILIIIFTLFIVIYQIYWPSQWISVFLYIIDSYLRLILTSWPAVVLIIFIFLLIRHRDTIDYLLKNNIWRVGNVETVPKQQSEESAKEIATGAIINTENESNAELKKEIERLNNAKTFERIYNLIFGSQINIISKTISNGGSLPIENVISIYNDTIFKNPGLKNYSFDTYIHFLINTGLLSFVEPLSSEKIIEITTRGKDFFNYIVSEKLDLFKPF